MTPNSHFRGSRLLRIGLTGPIRAHDGVSSRTAGLDRSSQHEWYLRALFPYRKGAAAPADAAKYAAGFIMRPLAAAAAAAGGGSRNGGGRRPAAASEATLPPPPAAAAAAAAAADPPLPPLVPLPEVGGGGDVAAVFPDTVTVLSANISPREGEKEDMACGSERKPKKQDSHSGLMLQESRRLMRA